MYSRKSDLRKERIRRFFAETYFVLGCLREKPWQELNKRKLNRLLCWNSSISRSSSTACPDCEQMNRICIRYSFDISNILPFSGNICSPDISFTVTIWNRKWMRLAHNHNWYTFSFQRDRFAKSGGRYIHLHNASHSVFNELIWTHVRASAHLPLLVSRCDRVCCASVWKFFCSIGECLTQIG